MSELAKRSTKLATDLVLLTALFVLTNGIAIAWRSRLNLLLYQGIATFLIGYLLPLFVLQQHRLVPTEIMDLYRQVTVFGAAAALLGIVIGTRVRIVNRHLDWLGEVTNQDLSQALERFVPQLTWIACLTMAASTMLMGFVPAFADDPLSAKFFRGEYADAYRPVAIPYRLSHAVLTVCVPLLAYIVWMRKKYSLLPPLLIGTALIAVSLTRGQVGTGLLFLLGAYLCAKGRWGSAAYFVTTLAAVGIGSAAFLLLGSVLDIPILEMAYGSAQTWTEVVAAGMPDLSDQLRFLTAFNASPLYSMGRTFFGGLIPFNYEWNPAVYSLRVLNQSESIEGIASGGLRLTSAIWGYTAFGWFGVALLPFITGLLSASIVRYAGSVVDRNRTAGSSFLVSYYITYIAMPLASFYTTGLYQLAWVVLVSIVIRRLRISHEQR